MPLTDLPELCISFPSFPLEPLPVSWTISRSKHNMHSCSSLIHFCSSTFEDIIIPFHCTETCSWRETLTSPFVLPYDEAKIAPLEQRSPLPLLHILTSITETICVPARTLNVSVLTWEMAHYQESVRVTWKGNWWGKKNITLSSIGKRTVKVSLVCISDDVCGLSTLLGEKQQQERNWEIVSA